MFGCERFPTIWRASGNDSSSFQRRFGGSKCLGQKSMRQKQNVLFQNSSTRMFRILAKSFNWCQNLWMWKILHNPESLWKRFQFISAKIWWQNPSYFGQNSIRRHGGNQTLSKTDGFNDEKLNQLEQNSVEETTKFICMFVIQFWPSF